MSGPWKVLICLTIDKYVCKKKNTCKWRLLDSTWIRNVKNWLQNVNKRVIEGGYKREE